MCSDCDILTLRMTRPVFEGLQKLLAKNKLIDGDKEIGLVFEETMSPELTLRMTSCVKKK